MKRFTLTAAAAILSLLVLLSFPLDARDTEAPHLIFASGGDGTCTLTGISGSAEVIVVPERSPAGDTVTAVADRAFAGDTVLRSISLPDTVSGIGFGAFADCTALTAIALPPSLTAVAEYTFRGCTSLRGVALPEGLLSIGEWAFCRTALPSVLLPESLRTIAVGAFSECGGLSAVTVPAGVSFIGEDAFRGCAALGSVTFRGAETEICRGENVFPSGTILIAPASSGAADYARRFGRTLVSPGGAEATLSLTGGEAVPGGTIDVAITLAGNPGIAFLKLRVAYDDAVLALEDCTPGTALPGLFETSRSVLVRPYILVFASAGNMTGTGCVATLRFRVLPGARARRTEIRLSAEQCFGEAGEVIPLAVRGGTVTVGTVLPGDVSGDGIVDGRDATLLLQYLTGWDVSPVLAAADLTGDGTIDGSDVTLLLRRLAEWDE